MKNSSFFGIYISIRGYILIAILIICSGVLFFLNKKQEVAQTYAYQGLDWVSLFSALALLSAIGSGLVVTISNKSDIPFMRAFFSALSLIMLLAGFTFHWT